MLPKSAFALVALAVMASGLAYAAPSPSKAATTFGFSTPLEDLDGDGIDDTPTTYDPIDGVCYDQSGFFAYDCNP